MTAEVASLISLVVSWGLLAIIVNWMISFYLIRQINDDDDDDDDDDGDDDDEVVLMWSTKVCPFILELLVPILRPVKI